MATFILAGDVSGSATIASAPAAGSAVLTLPTTTGTLLASSSAGTSGQVLTSNGTGALPTFQTAGGGFVAGMIMLWSGSSATIPSGWLLCNGTSGTPDLRNRFVVGATSTYAVNATGGSADAVLVSHTHTATVSDPGHTHTILTPADNYIGVGFIVTGNNQANPGFTRTTNSSTTGITVSNNTQGVSGTNANLPPYYALCYIMKS